MRLGDWTAPCPLQVVGLTKISDDLYDLRAVAIMSNAQNVTDGGVVDGGGGMLTHIDPMPQGVTAIAFFAPEYHAIINCNVTQAKAFAAHYGGVAHLRRDKIVIKAIAPGMRKEYQKC